MIQPNRVPGQQFAAPVPYQSGNAPALAFGSGGAMLQSLGHGLGTMADAVDRWAIDNDRTRVMEADQQFADFARTRLYDPESGYFNQKGRDAVTNAPSVQSDFDAHIALLSEGLDNDRQRLMFENLSAQRRLSSLEQVDRYSMNERESWLDQVSTARIQTAINDGAVEYGDPKAFLGYLGQAEDEIRAMATRKGWGPEVTEAKLNEGRANYVATIIDRTARQDPAIAAQILAHNQGVLTDRQHSLLSERLNFAQNAAQTKSVMNDLSAELAARPLYPESLADGQPAFSPDHDAFSMLKTAIDLKQGDDVRLKTLLARYQGNITLAVSAYSAGVESVSQWVKDIGDPRMGMIADQDFIQNIPDEKTRNSVQRIADRMEGVANGAIYNVPSIASMAARIVNNPNLSPSAKRNALSSVGALYGNQMKQRANQQFQAQKTAFDAVDQDGVFPDALTDEVKDSLGVKGMADLRDYQAMRAASGGMVATNPSYFNALPQMAASYPAALLHLDYAELRANLDDAQLARVMTWRDEALSGKRLSDVGVNERLMSDFFDSHGLKDQSRTTQQAMVRTDFYALMNEAEENVGRPLSYAEKQKVLDNYGIRVAKRGVLWDGEAPLWDIGVDDMPDGFRAAYLEQTGKKTATDQEMLSLYRRLVARGQVPGTEKWASPVNGLAKKDPVMPDYGLFGHNIKAPMPPERPNQAGTAQKPSPANQGGTAQKPPSFSFGS